METKNCVRKIKKSRNLQTLLFLSAIFLVIITFPGCDVTDVEQVPIFHTPLPLDTETVFLSPTNSITTPEPTWTPMPTLSSEILIRNLIELFSTNGGCDFPCWWGVNLDDSIQEVYALAPIVGESPFQYGGSYYSYNLHLDSLNLADFYVVFRITDSQTVRYIEVNLSEPARFRDYYNAFEERMSLASLLGRFGKPSEVLLLVEPRVEPDQPIGYALLLAYDLHGFVIEYSGFIDSEDPIRICSVKLNDYHLRYVSLYMQDPQQTIVERNRFFLNDFQPLDQVTSMSLDEFFQAFSDYESSRCIETSYAIWK
jgi:hypothetical protein